MNNIKLSNHVRLIAFFLTGAVLICTFGLTVDGWQSFNNDSVNNKKDNDLLNDTLSDIHDEECFFSLLTGLSTTEDKATEKPFAFVFDSIKSYGISASEVLIEIPIEDDEARYLALMNDVSELRKIGSIACTRGYINNLIKYFDSIGVHNGFDDIIAYDSLDISDNSIDLSVSEDYGYTENKDRIFTNYSLINSGLNDLGISTKVKDKKKTPFCFSNDIVKYEKQALDVTLGLSEKSYIKLIYSSEGGKYSYYNNDIKNTDSPLGFTNCFILFADSVTYDNANGVQLVVDTLGGGTGFYLTNGTYTSINWIADSSGTITFYFENSEKLVINKGNSYIGFFRSSSSSNISFN